MSDVMMSDFLISYYKTNNLVRDAAVYLNLIYIIDMAGSIADF